MMGRTFNGGIRAGAFVAWLLWNVGIDASITVDTPRKLSVSIVVRNVFRALYC